MTELLARLEKTKKRVMKELHPELRARLVLVLADLGGRVTPWEGYRGPGMQTKAFTLGHSAARWGQSPHNYQPALAVDVVLHPSHVKLAPHPDKPDTPNLWDYESPGAVATWKDLDEAAKRHGLERVSVNGKPDLPHMQLPRWRERIPQ